MKNIVETKLSHIIVLPKIKDEGYLCFGEGKRHIPFSIKRFYYIYDVINKAVRGLHAHKETLQYLFCVQGSITVVLDNGTEREEVLLNENNQGLFLDKMMWHEMKSFKKNTVLLILASDYYDEKDYIRDYTTFLKMAQNNQAGKWYNIPYSLQKINVLNRVRNVQI